MRAHPARIAVVLFIATAVIAGCGQRRSSRSGPMHQLKKSEMTAAELKYGIAPIPDPSVTYQPAVIVVGGGADAIRAQSSNGFIWTIDAHAPHAGELAEGKILFLTNRAVGRVLDVRKDGDNLAVTLGPIAITELIRKCDIHPGPIPIDLEEAIPYTAADLPGRVIAATRKSAEAQPWDANDATVTPAAFTTQSGSAPGSQAAPDVSNLVHFKTVPIVSGAGAGLRATSDGGGLKVALEAFVHIQHPTLVPVLRISGDGDLEEASLTLTGAAGLTIKFDAGTDVGLSANVNGTLQATPDYSLPLGGGALPVALTIRQLLVIHTALGVRNASLSATGDYSFGGSFFVGYKDKQWSAGVPIGFSTKQSLMGTMDGVAITASGLDVAHQMKMVFGVGALGFVTGPYFTFNTSVGLFKGPAISLECKQTTLIISMAAGVGYLIPKPVTDVINFILGTLHIRYRVDSSGGVGSKPTTMINTTSTLPACKMG